MAETSLGKKMKLTPGARAAVINAPGNFLQELKYDGELSQKLDGKFDWIQIFVKNKTELDELVPKAIKALNPVSILWISFPKGISKGQSDLTRDKGWESLQPFNLQWINLISINETWSAFSLRPYKEGEKRQSFR